MTKKRNYIVLLLLCATFGAYAQEKFIQNLSKLPASVNPSFHGFKDRTRIGVLSEFAEQNQGDQSESRYAFGSTAFEEYNFQLGLDLFSNRLQNSGFSYTTAALTYIYKLELANEWTMYPGVSAGYGVFNFNFDNLTFQDQINIFSGQINANSIDPTAASQSAGFFDLGASIMVQNEDNMVLGLSFKHLNRPKLSNNGNENNVNLDMLVSGQFGYEFDINPYGQSLLPENSYLYLFNVASVQGRNTRLDLYQDVTLGNISLGINEHLSYLESATFTELGIASSITLERFEVGLNYRLPVGSQAKMFLPNSLELLLVFDVSRFSERGRKKLQSVLLELEIIKTVSYKRLRFRSSFTTPGKQVSKIYNWECK